MSSFTSLLVVLFSLLASLASAQNFAASFPGGQVGNSSNVLLPPFNVPSLPYTIEAWMYATSFINDYGSIFYSRNSPNITGLFIRIGASGQTVPYELRSVANNLNSPVDTNISVTLNTWHHVALVVNSTMQVVYYDQVAYAYAAVNETPEPFNGPAYLGWDPAGTSRTFAGYIDEVRVWNVQKTAADFAVQSFSGLQGNETGLIAYYNFNTQNPTSAIDATGHGFNGVLNGVTYVTSTVFAQPSASSAASAPSSVSSASAASSASSASSASAASSRSSASAASSVSSMSAGSSVSSLPSVSAPTSAAAVTGSVVTSGDYAASFPGGSAGNTSNVLLPPFNVPSLPYTIEAWIYPTAFINDYGTIFLSRGNTPNITGLFIRIGASGQTVPYELRSVANNLNSPTDTNISVSLNSWHHVALVVNATTQVVYYDQVAYAYAATTETIEVFTVAAYLGWDPAGTSRTFAGYMDEVRIWNVQKTAADFAVQSFSGLQGNETGLIAYYNFNTQNAIAAIDSTGHNFTGALNGVTYVASTVFQQQPPSTSSAPAPAVSSASSASSVSAASASRSSPSSASSASSMSAGSSSSMSSAPSVSSASSTSAPSVSSASSTSAPSVSSVSSTSSPSAAYVTSSMSSASAVSAAAAVSSLSSPAAASSASSRPSSSAVSSVSAPTVTSSTLQTAAAGGVVSSSSPAAALVSSSSSPAAAVVSSSSSPAVAPSSSARAGSSSSSSVAATSPAAQSSSPRSSSTSPAAAGVSSSSSTAGAGGGVPSSSTSVNRVVVPSSSTAVGAGPGGNGASASATMSTLAVLVVALGAALLTL